jgi:hypothetical protein
MQNIQAIDMFRAWFAFSDVRVSTPPLPPRSRAIILFIAVWLRVDKIIFKNEIFIETERLRFL